MITYSNAPDEDAGIWQAFEHHSRTFSLAARLLPRHVQMPVATLYLFCRTVDNIADERRHQVGRQTALGELRALRAKLDHTMAGRPSSELLWRKLGELHASFELPAEPLHELIEGAEWDLTNRRVEDDEDFLTYCNLVGGSVGAMMLPFLLDQRAHAPTLEGPARALGTAMQITNIIRDVGEDLRVQERIYLPRTWMETYGIRAEDLNRPEPTAPYCRLMEGLMELAEAHYEVGLRGVESLPANVRLSIRSAARMYREILNEVRACCYDNLRHRAYVPLHRKLGLIAREGYKDRKARLRISPAPRPNVSPFACLAD